MNIVLGAFHTVDVIRAFGSDSIKFRSLSLDMRIEEMHCSTSHTEFVAVFVPTVSFLSAFFFSRG